MKKMRTDLVLEAWTQAQPAMSTTGNLSTDGRYLYSYETIIAKYGWSDDVPVVYNYTAKNHGTFISSTTSGHITKAWNHLVKSGFNPVMEGPPWN